jgi:hypothetical protein
MVLSLPERAMLVPKSWMVVAITGVATGSLLAAGQSQVAREDVLQAVLAVGLAGPIGWVGLAAMRRGGD